MSSDRGRAFWLKLFNEVESGASQTSVAKRYRISPSWLGKRCRALRDERPATALLPVRMVEGRARRVEIVVGNVRLGFEEGTDPAYVASVARALTA